MNFRPRHVEILERRRLLSVTALTPVADADVQDLSADGSVANSNFGADPGLRVRASNDEKFESFLTFDLSNISSVGHAVLKMHGGQGAGAASAQPVLVGAFPAPDEFIEGGGSHGNPLSILPGLLGAITWNNRPSTTGGAFGSAIVSTDGDYYWDLTNYVRASKTTGDDQLTLALRFTGGGNGQVTFDSRETSVADDAPKLLVEQNTAGPVATFFAPDVTTVGATTQQVVITYSDTDAIDTASIDVGDIDVRAPGGSPLQVTGVSVQQADANSIIATYTVAAPGGTWDSTDAPAYTTVLLDGAVNDVAGNPATGGPDVFTVVIDDTPPPSPQDTAKPHAAIDKPEDVKASGAVSEAVNVTFTDNVGVDASVLTTGSLLVARHGNQSTSLTVTNVSTSPSADGKTVAAQFTVEAPGGSWDDADNGKYDVTIVQGAVKDAAGNLSDEASSSFKVEIPAAPPPPPPPSDTTGPTTSIVPLDPLTEEGGADRQIRVTFVDDVAVNLSSIDAGDILVTAPDGSALSVSDVSVSPPAGGASVTATFTVLAHGGMWDSADNGAYAVTLAAGAAVDTSNNPSTAASGQFQVALPEPQPPVDPNFGGGTSTVNTGFVGEAAVAQSDGKIIVVGRQGDLASGASQLVIQRLNADGSLDASFGSGGKVLGAQGVNEAAFAVAVDPIDGSIVIAGTRGGDLMVSRLKANGTIDNRFGTGGIAVADFGGDDVAYSLVIAADGSIVAAGGSTTPGTGDAAFAFARFTKDGRPDPFFGDAGRSLFAQGNGGNVAGAVVLDASGRIVAAGPTDGGKVAVVRLDASGVQDDSLGAGGILVIDGLATRTDLGRPDRSIGIVAQADGSLLVTNHTAGGNFAIAKIGAGGTLDNSFGTNGIATVDFGGDDDADAILLQGSGEILVLGTTTVGGNQLAVAAITQDGSLISNFGDGGKLTVSATPTDASRELHIGDLVLRAFGSVTSDGRLVVGASDQRPAAVTSTPLRRLNVPGSGVLGTFGQVGGKKAKKLTFQDADGTVVTISLKGKGSGQAYSDGTAFDLVLSGVKSGTLVVKTQGGDGRVQVRNVQVNGPLKGVTAKTLDLAGTFSVMSGGVGKMSIGNLNGTLAVAGQIGALAVAGDVKGKVLSGANYGVNGKPGGTGTAADSFGQGRIGKITVAGSLIGATFAAGVDPVNQRLLDGNDKVIGGSQSFIGPVVVKHDTDPSTRFEAGAFASKVKLPTPTDPMTDPRFMLLQ